MSSVAGCSAAIRILFKSRYTPTHTPTDIDTVVTPHRAREFTARLHSSKLHLDHLGAVFFLSAMPKPLPMEEDLKGLEPTLNAEAGATADAARVAHGFADDQLHAGFIDKQTPLPPAEPGRPAGHPPLDVPPDVIEGLHLEVAVEREPSLNAEAGATDKAAAVAHGFADKDLHAGFISKQTPLSK